MNFVTFLTFLNSSSPLVKRFTRANDQLVKHPYPMVKDFTSTVEEVSTIKDLRAKLEEHALQGHCLLKGTLSRPLINESRKGSTDRNAPTNYFCLDADGLPYKSISEFLKDSPFKDQNLVFQYSSSHGLPGVAGIRGHVFGFSTEARPNEWKQLLMQLNLYTPALRDAISLSATGAALSWPLDITTCQNDKLIYIAPPIFPKGMKDPVPNRFISIAGSRSLFQLRSVTVKSLDALKKEQRALLNQLRKAAGLDPLKTSIRYVSGFEVQPKPGEATITDIKADRGFVYFNLNGGDSWGYFHPEDSFEYIHNFKGEPVYKTAELLPSYYKDCTEKQEEEFTEPTKEGDIILAFRDFKTATYFNGRWRPNENKLEVAMAKNETQLEHYLNQYGKSLPPAIPVWNKEFNPKSNIVVDGDAKTLNTYVPSEYMRKEKYTKVKASPEHHNALIVAALGAEEDPDTVEHFYNWLACIFQYRDKTMTAWVLQGVPGTGKGLLSSTLAKALGEDYVARRRSRELSSQFNGYLEHSILCVIDEMQKTKNDEFVQSDLLNAITEPVMSYRHMFRPVFNAPNYTNFIFLTNRPDATYVDKGDRRLNFGNYQRNKLQVPANITSQLDKEREAFVNYLMTRKADQTTARKILDNTGRRQAIKINKTSLDLISEALLSGDLQFFWDSMPDQEFLERLAGVEVQSHNGMIYRSIIEAVITEHQTRSNISREELLAIYEYLHGGLPRTPNKFTALLKHYNIEIEPIRKGEKVIRGLSVVWNMSESWFDERAEELARSKQKPKQKLKAVK